MKDEKEAFLSGVFSMVDTMEIPEWKGTPGAGHTVEEFVLQGTCGEGGNGELGMDKHNNDVEYENNAQNYEVAYYMVRHRFKKLGEYLHKYLGEIYIITTSDGV